MPGSKKIPVVGGPDSFAILAEDDVRQLILKVKWTMKRCLAQGMNKEQMFRVIREEGLHPGAAFAVYRELRHQNPGFFKEYYSMIDLKEQRQRLDLLVRDCRNGGRNTVEEAREPEPERVADPLIDMGETVDVPIDMDWQDQLQTLQAWLSDGGLERAAQATTRLLPNNGQPAASNAMPAEIAWPPQQVLNLPGWEQQPLANGAFQGATWRQQGLNLPPVAQQLYSHDQQQPLIHGAFQWAAWSQQTTSHLPVAQQQYNHQETAASGGFQGLTWNQQAAHSPAAQQNYQAAEANGFPALTSEAGLHNGFPPLTSEAGLPNDAMIDPWPPSHGDRSFWQQP